MNAHASLPLEVQSTLASVLDQLSGHEEKPLVIRYAGRTVGGGYHITEVKAGSFVTLDCGGNPDAWQETVLQVEDVAAEAGRPMMTAGKFRSILSRVDAKVQLSPEGRLTIEIGRPGEAMAVFDIGSVSIEGDQAVLALGSRTAICKPRHRASLEQASACGPTPDGTRCC